MTKPTRFIQVVAAAIVTAVAAPPHPAAGRQDPAVYRLSLGEAARLAAERSSGVQQARSRVDAAEARVRESTSALLPSLSADVIRGARTFNTASFGLDFPTLPGQDPFFDPAGEVVGPVRSTDVRAHAEVPLLDLSAYGRRRSARASVDAALQEEKAAEEGAAVGAAGAYLADMRAEAEIAAREQDLQLARDLLEIARGQLEAGVAIALDVTRAESQVATIQAQLIAARNRARIAELALRRSLRLSADTRVELTGTLDASGPDTPAREAAIARAMDSRDDLATAEAYRAAASESLAAVRAGRLPRLSAAVDDGYYGKGFEHMLNTYTWSVRLSVPLFDGFKRSAQMQAEEARIHEMEFRIEDLQSEVSFQVERALLNLSAAREQVGAVEERLRLSQLEVEQEEQRVRAGVAGTGDVVRAAMRLNEARTARLDVLVALKSAQVALAAAMGTVTELP